LLAKDVAVE